MDYLTLDSQLLCPSLRRSISSVPSFGQLPVVLRPQRLFSVQLDTLIAIICVHLTFGDLLSQQMPWSSGSYHLSFPFSAKFPKPWVMECLVEDSAEFWIPAFDGDKIKYQTCFVSDFPKYINAKNYILFNNFLIYWKFHIFIHCILVLPIHHYYPLLQVEWLSLFLHLNFKTPFKLAVNHPWVHLTLHIYARVWDHPLRHSHY